MTSLTRMIFGIQIPAGTSPMTLSVHGSLGTPPPPLHAHRREEDKTLVASWADGAWTLTLPADDYVVTIEQDDWANGLLEIQVDHAAGDDDPAFVYYGVLPQGVDLGPVAWRAVATVVDPPASSSTEDPKDPWPPPPPPSLWIALSSASMAWFSDALSAAWKGIQGQLRGNSGRGGPGDR